MQKLRPMLTHIAAERYFLPSEKHTNQDPTLLPQENTIANIIEKGDFSLIPSQVIQKFQHQLPDPTNTMIPFPLMKKNHNAGYGALPISFWETILQPVICAATAGGEPMPTRTTHQHRVLW